MKLVKSKDFQVRETTKTFYQDEKDILDNTIDLNSIKTKQDKIKLVEPMSKETAQYLWGIRDLNTKKEAIQKAADELKYMRLYKFADKLFISNSLDALDMIIADLLISSELSAAERNKKELEKANPFSIDE